MKRLMLVLIVAVALAGSAFAVRAGQCDFDLDCGSGMKCVGPVGSKVCVPK
ncbi:MAG: hypothetical protein JZU65_22690 [Chlorobium sp.]|nr:hypothetical protein [Chlorobium sp.]